MKRILLIEDDPRVAAALAIRLRNAGYDVVTAHDGEAGVRLASEHPPDLIITDLYLPQMNGFSVVDHVRRLGLAEVPFVVLTASQRNGLWEAAMHRGASAYFEKPYDPARFMAAIGDILNQHQNTQMQLPLP